jgi:hypothetical protein
MRDIVFCKNRHIFPKNLITILELFTVLVRSSVLSFLSAPSSSQPTKILPDDTSVHGY